MKTADYTSHRPGARKADTKAGANGGRHRRGQLIAKRDVAHRPVSADRSGGGPFARVPRAGEPGGAGWERKGGAAKQKKVAPEAMPSGEKSREGTGRDSPELSEREGASERLGWAPGALVSGAPRQVKAKTLVMALAVGCCSVAAAARCRSSKTCAIWPRADAAFASARPERLKAAAPLDSVSARGARRRSSG